MSKYLKFSHSTVLQMAILRRGRGFFIKFGLHIRMCKTKREGTINRMADVKVCLHVSRVVRERLLEKWVYISLARIISEEINLESINE